MLQLNEIKVIGRITHDLELGQGKAPYLRFQVAVPRPYRKDTEPESDFINAAAFYSTAEYIENYFGKGAPIYLNGSLRSEDYEDGDGNQRRSFTLMVNEAKFVLTKREAEALAAYSEESGGHEDADGRSGGRSNRNGNNGGSSGGRNGNSRNANGGQNSRQNRRGNQPDDDGDDQGGENNRSAGSSRSKAGGRSQGSGRSDGGNRSGRNGRSGSSSRQPDRNMPFDPDDDNDLPF